MLLAGTTDDSSNDLVRNAASQETASVSGGPLGPPSASIRSWVLEGLKVGDHFGPFVIMGMLGSGGMATVFRAHDERLDREVALKLLHVDLSDRHEQRLLREAQALARLSHPNVVQVFEVGDEQGLSFIAMEFVRGETLSTWRRTPRSWRDALTTYIQAGRGLAAAHEQDLIHRDFKPSNAIVEEGGRVCVLDFGLARFVGAIDAESAPSTPSTDSALEADLTRTGSIMGTLAYMAPEQRRGESATAASDQFSFFVSLYEALYGERPYEGDASAIVLGDPGSAVIRAPRSDARVPEAVRKILGRGLAIEPAARYPDLNTALEALVRVSTPKRGRWIAVAGIASVATVGVGLSQLAQVGFRCDGAQADMDAVWNPTTREPLESAFTASAQPYADAAWTRVSDQLDEYAQSWVLQRTEACEATRVRETQPESVLSLRIACLEQRRASLRQSIGVLSRAGEDTVLSGTSVVANLPALRRCENVAALQADVAPPANEAMADRVAAVRTKLAEGAALRDVAAYEESEERCADAVTSARASGYPPVLAEALVEQALSKLELGAYDEAEALLTEAYTLAAEREHRTVETKAAAELAYVIGTELRRYDEGLQWGIVALAASRRSNAEPDAEARAATNVADVLLSQHKDLKRARDLYLLALPKWEAAHGSAHPELGAIAHNLGITQFLDGRDGRGDGESRARP